MSAPAWDRSRPPASPSDSSASAGRPSASRRPASSSSDNCASSAPRTSADVRHAARRLRLGLLSALLCLPLLAGLAAPAAAQTPLNFWQQPVQFSSAEYEEDFRIKGRRGSEVSGGSGLVSVMFTKGGATYEGDPPQWRLSRYTVTYKVVDAESTATYGADYTLGNYNRNTNRGTIQVPRQGALRGSSMGELPVHVVDDSLVEGEETFVIEMVSISGAAYWVDKKNNRHKLSIAIDDNEPPSALNFDTLERTVQEGHGADTHDVRVSLRPQRGSNSDPRLPEDTHFEYCVESSATLGTDYQRLYRPATPGSDYEITNRAGDFVDRIGGTECWLATLPAGQTTLRLMTLRVLSDKDMRERPERVTVRLKPSTVAAKPTSGFMGIVPIPPRGQAQPPYTSSMLIIKDDFPFVRVELSGFDDGSLLYTVRGTSGPTVGYPTIHWVVEDDISGTIGSGSFSFQRGQDRPYRTVRFKPPLYDASHNGYMIFRLTDGEYRLADPSHGTFCLPLGFHGSCPQLQTEGSSDDQVAPPPQPTAAVANVQVTAVDDASARVTWDAVEHATSYRVEYESTSALVDPHNYVYGGVNGRADTTWTFDHNAAEAMTVTVTVMPEYVDGNGVTQRLADLAGTATIDVAPAGSTQDTDTQDAVQAHGCDLTSVKADVNRYIGETHYGNAHVARWERALAGLNEETGGMTAAGARQMMATYSPGRWQPVVDALDCLEAAAAAQPETPASVPEVTVSGGAGVTEGASASFTVTATPAPTAPLAVTLTVGQSGDYAASGETGTRQVTVPTGGSVAIEVATADDGTDEPDGSVSVTLDAGTGYTVAAGQAAGTVAVRDNDEPVVSIAAGSGVTEGAPAAFTLTANPAPHAALTVSLAVTQSGDYAASGQTGAREVTIPTGGSAAFEVATVNDGADEPDGSVTATLAAGSGYAVAASPDNTASVAVADDDVAAAGVPTLSVNDVEVKEGPYRRVEFTVTLSEPASRKGAWFYWRVRESSPVSAKRGVDFSASTGKKFASMRPGATEHRIMAALVIDDSHDEDPETFEIVLSDAHGAAIADGVGVATIVNDDPMPAAFLARFGRTVAEQALDGIAGRIAAPREAGAQGTIAGQALSFGMGSGSDGAANDNAPVGSVSHGVSLAQSDVVRASGASAERFGGGHGPDSSRFALGESRTVTARELLLGSSFTATGEADATGGSLAFWGRAAEARFDGREGTFSLDGEATTAMLGTDYARGDWLVGLALMQSSGEGGYADSGSGPQHCPDDMDASLCNGAVREGDGDVEASLTAAVPYAALQASERLRLWGSMGYGTGEVTLKPSVGGSLSSDIFWTMAAAGARSDLVPLPKEGSGPALALTTDALWARTSSDKTHELAASDSDVSRLRLGLEGSYAIATAGGGRLTPKVEVGARHDGGDAETGFGVELGGGLAWDQSRARAQPRPLGPHPARTRRRRPRGPGLRGLDGLRPEPGLRARAVADAAPGLGRTGRGRARRVVPDGPAVGARGRRRGDRPLAGGSRVRPPGLRRALHRQPACGAGARHGRARLHARLAADPRDRRPCPGALLRGEGDPPGERRRST